MRATPFSAFYPNSYRALINPDPITGKEIENNQRKFDLSESFYAKEYDKIKKSTQVAVQNMINESN